jgi:hypothetical protein
LTDIFTVDRPYEVRKKLKVSAQTDELLWRYRHYKYRYSAEFEAFSRADFSVNFDFLTKDKS